MSDNNLRPLRVMQLVSSEGVTGATQQALFMPMMTRMPKQRVKMLVVSLSPNAVPGAVLRQNGVPVYDVALSRQRFQTSAFSQLLRTLNAFRPDVIQAWGHTAQIASTWLRKRAEWDVKLVWSVANTTPLGRKPGLIDRQKLKYAAKFSNGAHGIVYTSEASASAHRRSGFPEDGHKVIPLGVDPTRFKPDFAARRKVREQLGLPAEAFVIGMLAPFQPEYDHTTLLKAVGDLIKLNPNIAVLLAGHGVQKGNAPLMALVGGGTLGTRTQLLGEWSDVASFWNACDLACSSALTDQGRIALVQAMLCGVPCVATGMGAQGEVIGQHGVAVEPGSAPALVRGITRVMQLTPEKRVFMANGARKHALANFVSIRSLQKYLQLYFDLVGRKLTAASAVPAPEIDATIPQPTAEEREALKNVAKPKPNKSVDMYELRDPDSLESRDLPSPEEQAAKQAAEGDVLNLFESAMAKQVASGATSPMSERARGVADEEVELLSPELLASSADETPATEPPKAAPAKSNVKVDAPKPSAVAKVESATPLLPMESAPWLSLAAEEPKAAEPVAAQEPTQAKSAVEAKRADSEPAPKVELTFADTMSLSVQFSSTSATGTLEIPADLIFTSVVPVTKPAAMAKTSPPAASAQPATAGEVAQATPMTVVATAELAAPIVQGEALVAIPVAIAPTGAEVPIAAESIAPADAPASVNRVETIAADSSTVPALAIDELLTASAIAPTVVTDNAQSRESVQLDLLADPIIESRVAAS